MKTTAAFLGGAAFGAGLMFIADPILGKRRRAIARDTAVHGAKVFSRAANITSRDMSRRLNGILAETKNLFTDTYVDDAVLADRVRTEVGRVCSHPNVEVIVEDGCVTLQGPVVDREEQAVLEAAQSVKGVCGVINRMEPHKPLQNIATQASRERQLDIMQSHWAPTTRLLAGTIGAIAATTGFGGGFLLNALTRLVGVGLVARAASNIEFSRLITVPEQAAETFPRAA